MIIEIRYVDICSIRGTQNLKRSYGRITRAFIKTVLLPYNLQWKRRDALLEVSEAAEHDAADPFHIFYVGPTMSFSMRPL